MFTLYNWLITFHVFFSFFACWLRQFSQPVLIMSSMIPFTILSLDTDETLALSITLIPVLTHFQRTTYSQIYFRFSSYLLRKPLLIRSTAFICNIDRDWMIYRKHPIRSPLTSMLRKASILYPSKVYTLSFEKYKVK